MTLASTQAATLPRHAAVVIAGGGPVGMTLALTLRRAGITAVVLDDKPGPREHSKAAVLWPRTLEIFDLLGVVARWHDRTFPLRSVTLDVDDHIRHVDLTAAQSPHPFPLMVGQDVTERLLDAALRDAGAPVVRTTTVQNVGIASDGATIAYARADGSTGEITADWIVGCDGSGSIVREAAHIARSGARNAGVQILQGDMKIGGSLTLPDDRAYLWTKRGASDLLVLPVDAQGHYRVLVTVADDGKSGDPTLEDLERLCRPYLPDIRLFDPVWLSRYRTQHLNADRYRAGRAIVAGDAAHVWVPLGGQGMNTGIHDAFDLGWKLAAVVHGAADSVLDSYDAERRPIAAAVIAQTETAYRAIIEQKSPLDRLLRAMMPHVVSVPGVTAALSHHLDEFDVQYPHGDLVDDAGGEGIAPGRRAPDALVNSRGDTVRLFDLFRAGRFVLLGWAFREDDADALRREMDGLAATFGVDAFLISPSPAQDGESVRALTDRPRTASHRYGLSSPALHLIRPDGVIAMRAGMRNLASGRAQIERILTRAIADLRQRR